MTGIVTVLLYAGMVMLTRMTDYVGSVGLPQVMVFLFLLSMASLLSGIVLLKRPRQGLDVPFGMFNLLVGGFWLLMIYTLLTFPRQT
ncbi:MAG TPA: hypothetical protein PKE55_09275 [Kiritimatiellia bacterium]|nr:hypothetical protein [Kiritimatiellia bacterium]